MDYDTLAAPDYVVIAGVLAVFSFVGVYFRFSGGRQKTTREFLRADGEIGLKTIIVSVLPNLVSSGTLITVTSEMYLYGSQFWTCALGYFVAAVFTTYAILPVFYNLNIYIVYEYMEKRFGKWIRSTVSALYTLHTVVYMGVCLYGPAHALYVVTGLSIWTSVLSLTSVCVFYSVMGGLKAVLWTNILQALIMFFCVLSILVKGVMDSGGIGPVIQVANEGGQIVMADFSVSLAERYTFWNSFFHGFVFGIFTFACNQVQVQRLMSVKSKKEMRRASLGCAVLGTIGMILCFLIATVMYSLLHKCDPLLKGRLSSRDQLVPHVIMVLFDGIPAVRGLCVSGIFSSMLSITSSMLNSLANVTMEDFFLPYCFGKTWTGVWNVLAAKLLVFAYGCLNVLMVYIISQFPGIFVAYGVFAGISAAPIVGVFLLGLFTYSANEKGTLLGVAFNIVIISWIGMGSMTSGNVYATLPRSTEGCPMNTTETRAILKNDSADIVTFFAQNMSGITEHQEKYIFPLYRISFVWLIFLGAAVCFIVGYFGSCLTGCLCKAGNNTHKSLVSPVISSCACLGKDENISEENRKNGLQSEYSNDNLKTSRDGDSVTKL